MEAHSLPRAGGLVLPRSRRLLAALGDERLVDQVRRGNDAAFEAIYDRHHRGILSFCRHMLSSIEEAEDAVQHTFVAAYDSIRSSEREINLKPWLFTIARNRCLSVLRARREQVVELEDVPTAGLSSQVQRRSDLRDLLDDIRELPDDQRAALVLSELGDLSHTDIAGIVGCEVAKVKSLVFQARSSLLESRKARETPCEEIREQIATLRGGALRRGTLRRHIKHCQGCAEFREEVRRQRKMVAAVLPVIPSVALRHSALTAAGIGGGGGALAGGGAVAGGGGISAIAGASGAAKITAIVAAAGLAVGGGLEVAGSGNSTSHSAPPSSVPVSPNASPRATGDSSIFPPASPAARGHVPSSAGKSADAQGRSESGATTAHGRGLHRGHGHRGGVTAHGPDATPMGPAPGAIDPEHGMNGRGTGPGGTAPNGQRGSGTGSGRSHSTAGDGRSTHQPDTPQPTRGADTTGQLNGSVGVPVPPDTSQRGDRSQQRQPEKHELIAAPATPPTA